MNSNKWSAAAMYGLLLALITVFHTLINTVFEPGTAIKLILWVVKFVGVLWLLYYFIKDYAKPAEIFTYKEGFAFGFLICLFSSVICAAYMFLHFAVIFPDAVAAQMETVLTAMQSSNPEALDNFAKIQGILPQIVFAFSLFYYVIFGVIASAVIANYTKKGDIFTKTEAI